MRSDMIMSPWHGRKISAEGAVCVFNDNGRCDLSMPFFLPSSISPWCFLTRQMNVICGCQIAVALLPRCYPDTIACCYHIAVMLLSNCHCVAATSSLRYCQIAATSLAHCGRVAITLPFCYFHVSIMLKKGRATLTLFPRFTKPRVNFCAAKKSSHDQNVENNHRVTLVLGP